MRFMPFVATVLIALLAYTGAQARKMPREVLEQTVSSLLVDGMVTIDRDGGVQSYALNPAVKLTPFVGNFVSETIKAWRFEPVEVQGKPHAVTLPMSFRLVARPGAEGTFDISIVGTRFDVPEPERPTDLVQRATTLARPKFPMDIARKNGKGTVYLLLQVGRDGTVMNAAAEQVNLRVYGTKSQMNEVRKRFADAALATARTWTFIPPSTGEDVDEPYWLVRVPVDFSLNDDPPHNAYQWKTYIPGPRNTAIPWARKKLQVAGAPDALPETGIFPLQQGAKLLTQPTT